MQHEYIALQHNDDGADMTTETQSNILKPAASKRPAKSAAAAKTASKKGTATTDKLVSNIIAVSETHISNGANKMTKTAEQTAETVTAKAKDFFADIQGQASEAAEKGKKFAADAMELQKANLAALVEAGKIAAKGAQEMGKVNFEFAKSNFADLQAAVKEIIAVRNPTDFSKVQTEVVKKAFDTAVSQASKNTETTVKLVSEIFQPISNRIAVTTDFFKKAD